MTHDELVEKMCEVFWDVPDNLGPFQKFWEENKQLYRKAMSAALRAAVEELLEEPNSEEMSNNWNECTKWPKDRNDWPYLIKELIASRRSRYLKPRRPEDRVTIKQVKIGVLPNFWNVFLDGRSRNVQFLEESDAAIYRLGLIEKLKYGEL